MLRGNAESAQPVPDQHPRPILREEGQHDAVLLRDAVLCFDHVGIHDDILEHAATSLAKPGRDTLRQGPVELVK